MTAATGETAAAAEVSMTPVALLVAVGRVVAAASPATAPMAR
ncbi:hypothetical protein [Mycobacterium sp. UM_Kg1]|nr:hypothetical protein [Mycobacterium sp. UM_Kg1]